MRYVATVNLVLEAADEESAETSANTLLASLPISEYQVIEVFDPQS